MVITIIIIKYYNHILVVTIAYNNIIKILLINQMIYISIIQSI
jgi:hypothetical protein